MGLFITFEGIEGCGKTTQLELAADKLGKHGYPAIVTAEPGGTPLGKKIREILLKRSDLSVSAEAELFMFLADRAQHVREVIMPALKAGKIVLCDRFSDATVAYQGYGRGLPIEMIEKLNSLATAGLVPDLTILLDLKIETGLGRLRNRATETDRMEKEEIAFHSRVRQGYLTIAREEKERVYIVDASKDMAAVHREVMGLIEGLIREKRDVFSTHSRP